MKYILIFLILVSLCIGQTNITSLPYTCSAAGTYVVTCDSVLNAAATAITVSANNVIINGNNKIITYGNSSAGQGVLISGSRTNCQVYNLTIRQEANGTYAIYNNVANPSGLNVHDCILRVEHNAVYAISIRNFTANLSGINISNNIIYGDPTVAGLGNLIDIQGSGTPQVTGAITLNTLYVSGQYNSSRPSGIFLSNLNGIGALNLSNNTIVMDGPDDNNGIRLWMANNVNIYYNNITMNGDHSRGINIDGGSHYNNVYNNTIDANVPATIGSSSGIRVRYGSDSNLFHHNNINGDDAFVGGFFALRVGEVQTSPPDDVPSKNKFYENYLHGNTQLLRLEGASDSTAFWCNDFVNIDNGYAVYFITGVGQQVNAMYFCNNTYTGSNSVKVYFNVYDGTSVYTNIHFDGDATDAQITENGVTGRTITGSCGDHTCEGEVPPISDPVKKLLMKVYTLTKITP